MKTPRLVITCSAGVIEMKFESEDTLSSDSDTLSVVFDIIAQALLETEEQLQEFYINQKRKRQ